MKLKPIPLALGMDPAHWAARFSFMSKWVWWHERESHTFGGFRFKSTAARMAHALMDRGY